MDWAPWGPTLVSAVFCVFSAGVLYSNQNSHASHLKEHDKQLEDHTRDITTHSIEIAKLKAFQDGFAAARALYEKSRES
jgi:hypothetical protein